MSVDQQLDEAENTIARIATKCMEEFMVVSLNLIEIFNPWDFIGLNLAYLTTVFLGSIVGLSGSYTDGIMSTIMLNSRVYIGYMYFQAAKRRYIDLNHSNNDNDKQ